jgi:glycosyltransferase involved in cell wall biosynthesis
VLVTDCVEQARVVTDAAAGIVTGDGVDAIADGIVRVASASQEVLDRWSERARSASRGASWTARAAAIAAALEVQPG